MLRPHNEPLTEPLMPRSDSQLCLSPRSQTRKMLGDRQGPPSTPDRLGEWALRHLIAAVLGFARWVEADADRTTDCTRSAVVQVGGSV